MNHRVKLEEIRFYFDETLREVVETWHKRQFDNLPLALSCGTAALWMVKATMQRSRWSQMISANDRLRRLFHTQERRWYLWWLDPVPELLARIQQLPASYELQLIGDFLQAVERAVGYFEPANTSWISDDPDAPQRLRDILMRAKQTR